MSIFTQTENGAKCLKSTGKALVNLFFNIGASRNNLPGIKNDFDNAMAADMRKAVAILLFARDVRHGGAGERGVFRTLFPELIASDLVLAEKVLYLIPDLGRFDDLKVAYGTPLESNAVGTWVHALVSGNALAFKWADRSDKLLQKALHMNEAALRKFIADGRRNTVVETAMCNKEWSAIDYSKLPSVAGLRHSKAFKRNDEARYIDFMKSKETKVNAAVAFPYDVFRLFKAGEVEAASKYWENLAALEVSGNILPMCDVSGSMTCSAAGTISCLDVSVSLGVFLAQRIKGAFNGKLITFSETPTMVSLPHTKDLGKLFNFVEHMNWGMNTNFQKAFEIILRDAKRLKVAPKDMPEILLVLSDMAFDRSSGGDTLNNQLKADYAAAGYKVPRIVYWNLNAKGNFPVQANEDGVGLVSGFSPHVLKAVLAAKDFSPESIMQEAIEPFEKMLDK